MRDIGKVKLTMQLQKKSLQKVWEWLEKYVAPSLKLFAEVGKIEQRDYIGNLVKNGEMNITQKQLYDDYIKSSRLAEEERRAFDRKYQTESIRQKKTAMTVNEASEYTGIGRNSLRKLIAWKKIPVIRIGNKILIRSEVLDRFLQENEGHNRTNKYDVIAM